MPNGTKDIEFYTNGLGAVELFRVPNEDGSIHVAELAIDGAVFHLHEETIYNPNTFHPMRIGGVTSTIGLFVEDVHELMARAIAAGATEKTPVTDHDYSYRQGEFIDPFGHHWMIEKKI